MGVQIQLFSIEIDFPQVMRTVHTRYTYDIAEKNADKSDSSHSDVDIAN